MPQTEGGCDEVTVVAILVLALSSLVVSLLAAVVVAIWCIHIHPFIDQVAHPPARR